MTLYISLFCIQHRGRDGDVRAAAEASHVPVPAARLAERSTDPTRPYDALLPLARDASAPSADEQLRHLQEKSKEQYFLLSVNGCYLQRRSNKIRHYYVISTLAAPKSLFSSSLYPPTESCLPSSLFLLHLTTRETYEVL